MSDCCSPVHKMTMSILDLDWFDIHDNRAVCFTQICVFSSSGNTLECKIHNVCFCVLCRSSVCVCEWVLTSGNTMCVTGRCVSFLHPFMSVCVCVPLVCVFPVCVCVCSLCVFPVSRSSYKDCNTLHLPMERFSPVRRFSDGAATIQAFKAHLENSSLIRQLKQVKLLKSCERWDHWAKHGGIQVMFLQFWAGGTLFSLRFSLCCSNLQPVTAPVSR